MASPSGFHSNKGQRGHVLCDPPRLWISQLRARHLAEEASAAVLASSAKFAEQLFQALG
jgi:hypothetical protein